MPSVTGKIADIGMMLGTDANAFIKIRFALEALEQDALEGDQAAARILQLVDQFHRLMLALTKDPQPQENDDAT